MYYRKLFKSKFLAIKLSTERSTLIFNIYGSNHTNQGVVCWPFGTIHHASHDITDLLYARTWWLNGEYHSETELSSVITLV